MEMEAEVVVEMEMDVEAGSVEDPGYWIPFADH